MTEEEWLASDDPAVMLDFLRATGRASDRRLRLFAVACSRRVWDLLDPLGRGAVEVAEQHADGRAGPEELRAARLACRNAGGQAAWYAAATSPAVAARNAALSARHHLHPHAEADLLRDVFFNPFQSPPAIPAGVLTWGDGCIVKLASNLYEERDFSPERMGVLADAMEEAGVSDAEVLGHLRGPGAHCRGCWCVDFVLGRE